jgi:hypothetical protein
MPFLDDFRAAMILSASKVVAPNDIAKKAYHTPVEQQGVMSAAGLVPVDSRQRRTIDIRIAGTDEVLASSYYPARLGTDRNVEPRIGRDLVNWVSAGDVLWLGTDGTTVFAWKEAPDAVPADPDEPDPRAETLANQLSDQRLLDAVNAVGGPAGQRSAQSWVYERSSAVRAFARRRSGGICEMPGCGYRGFLMANGKTFIEVHHIEFMGRAGEDTVGNVAALCPNCHRRAHYARDRNAIRTQLLSAVRAANDRFIPTLARPRS